jgi:copper chaperone
MEETTYEVSEMTCEHCVAAVTREVSALPGVESVDVDLARGTVVVRGEQVSDEGVRAAVDEAGYAVT